MSSTEQKNISQLDKRENIRFARKDEALREDVHALGEMIGDMLLEQGGEALYKNVELARRLAIGRREGNSEDKEKLDTLMETMSTSAARDVSRAFSTYFQVVNTAEQVHRIRRRRDYMKDADIRQSRSLDSTIFELRDAGYELDAVMALLEKITIESVFTPHPTEITRRTVLRKQQHIVRRMMELQNSSLTPLERDMCLKNIRAEITTIWQTEEIPSEGTTVFDELEHILFFFTDVIYRVIPPFYQQLERALRDAYDEAAITVQIPTMLRFTSWIGGDMSSAEDMSARVIRTTLHRHRSLILDLYYTDCRVLAEKLSQSTTRIEVDDEIFDRIAAYELQFPEHSGSIPQRYRNMPYRVLMRLIAERLQATYDDGAFPYESAAEFIADLELIAHSLAGRKGINAGLNSVKRLIRKARTFGFHFIALDIRQQASELQRAVGFCLDEPDWRSAKRAYRIETLQRLLEENASPVVEPDNDTKRIMSVFQAISYCRRKFGSKSIGLFLVRHCQGVDDVFAAMLIAKWADLNESDGNVSLDIAPEFDTNQELGQSGHLLSELINNSLYKNHLAARNSQQTVMLSNAESARDCGLGMSRWKMHEAHSELNQILTDAKHINYTLFHGRGSLSSRSGVIDENASGHLRIAEYGESINNRYGIQGIALRTFEKAFSMVTTRTASTRKSYVAGTSWRTVMQQLAEDSDESYQQLVNGEANFAKYFRRATPIDVIELTRIGSGKEINEVDIPWEFAWGQSRFLLPQWFGLGTGLSRAIEQHGLETLQKMVQDWPFFTRLVDDVETALAIADMDIAERYSMLAGDHLHQHFLPVIRAEFELSVSSMLTLRNRSELLEENATLRRSIILRNPYVDPMSLLQVELLKRWRSGDRQDRKLQTALLASVNGIARGLQTSA
jgi:phosphoenolpyruvate carboxylase